MGSPKSPATTLVEFGNSEMKRYGEETLERRSIPALPDGFKPVQRRILHALHDLRALPSKRHMKAGRVVGEVLGKYHPHGDCLSGNTIVALCNGERPKLKDMLGKGPAWVWAMDSNGNIVPAQAHSWRIGQIAEEWYEITLSTGDKIRCTGNHPFFNVRKNKWVKAEKLKAGIQLAGGYVSSSAYPYVQLNNGFSESLHTIAGTSIHGALAENHVFHHMDENTSNNEPENIQHVSRGNHAKEHKDYTIGLDAGRATMFGDKPTKLRKAIKAKNAALAKEVSKHYGLHIALKGLRTLEAAGKKLTLKNYQWLVQSKLVYNLVRYETLQEKGYSFKDLLDYHKHGVEFDSSEATGLTAGIKTEYKTRESDQQSGPLNRGIASVLKGLDLQTATWRDYNRQVTKLARKNKSIVANGHKMVYTNVDKILERYDVDSPLELATQILSNHLLSVVKIRKRTTTKKMYDFTVDQHENMLIVTGEDSNGHENVVVAHNSSIYEAMVNMANSTTATINGQGNWGGIADQAGAYRYTECRLESYAMEAFFEPDYWAVADMMPTYDDELLEPKFLPALECNLLINGVEGISVGATCRIPSFKRKSVSDLMLKALKKTKLTVKDVLTTLEFEFKYDAKIMSGRDNRVAIETLIKTGRASLRLAPRYKMSEKDRSITVYGFTGAMHSGKLIEKVANDPLVQVIEDLTDAKGPKQHITFKRDVDFKTAVPKILKHFEASVAYRIAYILPKPRKGRLFHEAGIIELVYDWLEVRRELEMRMLKNKVTMLDELEERLLLMKLAHDNRAKLDACRDKPDPKEWLIKNLKFRKKTLEGRHATFLLNLTVMQLTKIHKGEIDRQIREATAERKSLKKQIGNVDANLVKYFKETSCG